MKNKSLLLITVLFGLMLIGIVVIQAGWIQRVRDLNQKAFNDAVYKSLGTVVKQVEDKENFAFIKHQVETDTLLKQTKRMLKHNAARKKSSSQISVTPGKVQISVSSEDGKQTKTIVHIEKNNNGNKYVHNSIYVGAAVIDSAGTIPEPPQPPPFTFVSAEDRKESVEIIMEKMLSLKNPDSVSVSPAEIEKMIATQLKQNNLPEKFTFALLSKDPKKSYIKLPGDNKDGWAPYKVNLYPNDLFGREVTLALMFPVKDTIIRFDEWWAVSLSLLFTITLFVLFIYSIRLLVRHKKMLAQKNDFINHMSHEFKTPLAGISLGADMLLEKIDKMNPGQINHVANIIKKQSERLNKEVTGVLLSAQLEENANNNNALFNLVDTIKTQAGLFSLELENKGARITTHFSDESIILNGDEPLWQKVFSNLLDNSLKFSKESLEISVFVAKTTGGIKIEFSDNGIGIAQKDLPHVFEKFYRSNYNEQSNIQGFGLGLNFVKKVVDSHKGTIKAESELGKGTKITIEINA